MVHTETDFRNRLAKHQRQHAAMARGYAMCVRSDGLMVVQPNRPKSWRWFRLRLLAYMCVGFIVFKASMLSAVGQANYEARVAKLHEGNVVAQSCAWIMQVDPVTASLVQVAALMRG